MEVKKGGFILTKVTDYGIVKSSRKARKKSVKMHRECLKIDARMQIKELSTRKKNAYTARKLIDLEACVPMSGKRKRCEDYLNEKLEVNRSVRRKEEDRPEVQNTPTNENIATSSTFKYENLKKVSKFENAPLNLAARTDGFNVGKVKQLASIFGKFKNKEVNNISEGVSQANDPGLASKLANGREPSKSSGKKRTWELGQKGAVLPPNVIGADFDPRGK